MKDPSIFEKIKNYFLYAGADKKQVDQIQDQIAAANLKALRYWSILVSLFWIYCLCMSLAAKDYERCRPAYLISLCSCVFIFLCTCFLIPRFSKALRLFKFIFRLSLLGGGIDTIYRIGGDEFCIIITEPIEKTQRCLSRLEELTASWHGDYIDSLSVSTGVASIKGHESVESVFAEADKKMYAQKQEAHKNVDQYFLQTI